MFDSFGNSWKIVKASWAVLQADKELLLFPVISGVVMIILSIVMLIPSLAITITVGVTGGSDSAFGFLNGVGIFLFYLVSYSVSIYFNVALVSAAMIRLDGGDPTLKDGINVANSKLVSILSYAAISATVGMILRWLQEQKMIGEIVSSIIGLAWNLATFLVIPILVARDVGPIEAIKESASLLKRTWGEQVTGGFSMGGIFFLIYLAAILLSIVIMVLFASMNSSSMIFFGVILIVLMFITIAVFQGALGGIFQATLYRFAETGVTPDDFDVELIRGAFKEKNKNKN